MPIPHRFPCILAACCCLGTSATADTKLIYEMDGVETFSIAIRGDVLRWDFASGTRPLMTIAYDNKRRQLSMVDEKRKRIYQMNDETLAAQRARDARRKRSMEVARRNYRNMSPERRREFEKRLQPWQVKRLQGDGGDDKDPTTIRMGKTTQIQGYPCQYVNTILNEQPRSQVCVAGHDAIGMSKEDYKTLAALFRFLGELTKSRRMESIHFARNLKGVPLQMKDNRRGKVQTIRSISHSALAGSDVELPPYERVDPTAGRKRRR